MGLGNRCSHMESILPPESGANLLSPVKSELVLYRNMIQGYTGAYRCSLLKRYIGCDNTRALAYDWALRFWIMSAIPCILGIMKWFRIGFTVKTPLELTERPRKMSCRKTCTIWKIACFCPQKESKMELRRILAFIKTGPRGYPPLVFCLASGMAQLFEIKIRHMDYAVYKRLIMDFPEAAVRCRQLGCFFAHLRNNLHRKGI